MLFFQFCVPNIKWTYGRLQKCPPEYQLTTFTFQKISKSFTQAIMLFFQNIYQVPDQGITFRINKVLDWQNISVCTVCTQQPGDFYLSHRLTGGIHLASYPAYPNKPHCVGSFGYIINHS